MKSFYNMYKRCPRTDSTLAIYRSPFYDVIISHAREVQFIYVMAETTVRLSFHCFDFKQVSVVVSDQMY